MFAMARCESVRARAMPRKSPLTSTMRADCIAMSVPWPMAIPTFAWVSAGASLTPSPAMATIRPDACSSLSAASKAVWVPRSMMRP